METLGRILTKVEDLTPPEERPGIVYKIKCICGDFYIGETQRSLTTRMEGHKAACRFAAFERSAVAEHAWQAGHEIEWDDVEITRHSNRSTGEESERICVHQTGVEDE